MARKEAIHMMDLKRNSYKKEGRMSDIEEEARQRTMHLLERANKLKLEQEDEIKKCNKIILETKCRAIRDAQVSYSFSCSFNFLKRIERAGLFGLKNITRLLVSCMGDKCFTISGRLASIKADIERRWLINEAVVCAAIF